MKPANDGPAFPVTMSTEVIAALHKQGHDDVLKTMCGMTLRQWYAGQEKTCPPLSWVQSNFGNHIIAIESMKGVEFSRVMAKWRFQMADAMIEEEQKP